MNSGYLYVLGLTLEMHLKPFGTFKSLFKPIKAVGVKVRLMKLSIGYQYQCWVNIIKPIMAFCLKLPSLVVKEIVAFLPAALMIPYERIAPILDRMSSCLSFIILLYSFLIVATFGS